MAKLYTKCDEIPLCKFIELYKGNLKALVISGKANEEELRKTSFAIIEEYNEIIGNKNLRFAILRHSSSINYNIKIIIFEIAENLLMMDDLDNAFALLSQIGINAPTEITESTLSEIKRSIDSIKAHTQLKLALLNQQIERSKPKDNKIDFTKERMIVCSHYKMHIDPKIYTAAEYAYLVKMMLNEIEQAKRHGK